MTQRHFRKTFDTLLLSAALALVAAGVAASEGRADVAAMQVALVQPGDQDLSDRARLRPLIRDRAGQVDRHGSTDAGLTDSYRAAARAAGISAAELERALREAEAARQIEARLRGRLRAAEAALAAAEARLAVVTADKTANAAQISAARREVAAAAATLAQLSAALKAMRAGKPDGHKDRPTGTGPDKGSIFFN